MKFRTEKGKKSEDDQRLQIETDGFEQISYEDLFKIVKFFYENENRIYPPPQCKGSKMLVGALVFLESHSVRETLLKYQLKQPNLLSDFV